MGAVVQTIALLCILQPHIAILRLEIYGLFRTLLVENAQERYFVT